MKNAVEGVIFLEIQGLEKIAFFKIGRLVKSSKSDIEGKKK